MYDGHKCGFYVFYLSKGHKQSDLCLSSGFFHLSSLLNIFAVNLILLNSRAGSRHSQVAFKENTTYHCLTVSSNLQVGYFHRIQT